MFLLFSGSSVARAANSGVMTSRMLLLNFPFILVFVAVGIDSVLRYQKCITSDRFLYSLGLGVMLLLTFAGVSHYPGYFNSFAVESAAAAKVDAFAQGLAQEEIRLAVRAREVPNILGESSVSAVLAHSYMHRTGRKKFILSQTPSTPDLVVQFDEEEGRYNVRNCHDAGDCFWESIK